MRTHKLRRGARQRVALLGAATALAGLAAVAGTGAAASADTHRGGIGFARPWFEPGNLVVSTSTYEGQASLLTPGVTELPPGCTGSNCVAATNDGSYPGVFNNVLADPAFGVASPVYLDQITPGGRLVNSLKVPDGAGPSGAAADHVVTSFSSKSELALNLSTNGQDLSFMGYYATPDSIDVSNANTPGDVDPTNPVTGSTYRVAAVVNKYGQFRYTLTNAYSGDNGRAAILSNTGRTSVLYMAGNASTAATRSPTASSPAPARRSPRRARCRNCGRRRRSRLRLAASA
jgi:hypothetical protein